MPRINKYTTLPIDTTLLENGEIAILQNGNGYILANDGSWFKFTNSLNITQQDINNWNDAFNKRHTHANKDALDIISFQSIDNWDVAYNLRHTHANKSVLDGITQNIVDTWTNDRFNAIPYGLTGTNANANDVHKSGFYMIGYGTQNTGTTVGNANDNIRALLHFETEDVYSASQIQTERGTGSILSRTKYDGIWTSWARAWSNVDFTQADINNWKFLASYGATQQWVTDNFASINHTHSFLQSGGSYNIDTNTILEDNKFKFLTQIESSSAGLFPTVNNANSILSIASHVGGYGNSLGFNGDNDMFVKSIVAGNYQPNWEQVAYRSWVNTNFINKNHVVNGITQGNIDNWNNAYSDLFGYLQYISDVNATNVKGLNMGYINSSTANKPTNVNNGVSLTLNASDSMGYEMVGSTSSTDSGLYVRSRVSGSWGTFEKLATMTDLSNLGSGYISKGYNTLPSDSNWTVKFNDSHLGVLGDKLGLYTSLTSAFIDGYQFKVSGGINVAGDSNFGANVEIGTSKFHLDGATGKLRLQNNTVGGGVDGDIITTADTPLIQRRSYLSGIGELDGASGEHGFAYNIEGISGPFMSFGKLGNSDGYQMQMVAGYNTTTAMYRTRNGDAGQWNPFRTITGWEDLGFSRTGNQAKLTLHGQEKVIDVTPLSYTGTEYHRNFDFYLETIGYFDVELPQNMMGEIELTFIGGWGNANVNGLLKYAINVGLNDSGFWKFDINITTSQGLLPYMMGIDLQSPYYYNPTNQKSYIRFWSFVSNNEYMRMFVSAKALYNDLLNSPDSFKLLPIVAGTPATGRDRFPIRTTTTDYFLIKDAQLKYGGSDALVIQQNTDDTTGYISFGSDGKKLGRSTNGELTYDSVPVLTLQYALANGFIFSQGNPRGTIQAYSPENGLPTDSFKPIKSGFYRPNGENGWGSLMIGIAHPQEASGQYYAGLAFDYSGTEVYLTGNDSAGNKLPNKKIWHAENFIPDEYWKKYFYGGYTGINANDDFAILNNNQAQRLLTSGLLISGNYTDRQFIPNQGLYSMGNIRTSGIVLSDQGFQNTVYVAGRNRIWSFGNSDQHGLSYQQGGFVVGGNDYGEGINFHFGDSNDFKVHIRNSGDIYTRGQIVTDNYGFSNQWYLGYLRSFISLAFSKGSSGDVWTFNKADGTTLSTVTLGMGIMDTRNQGNGLGSDGSAGYIPPSSNDSLSNKVTPLFHSTGNGWQSSLIMKGWSGNYKAWRITGDANADDVERDLYLSLSKSSDGSWLPERKIWTDKHFSEANITSWNNMAGGNFWKVYDNVSYMGISDNTAGNRPFSFLFDNGNYAKAINTGGVLASDSYGDQNRVPTNGGYFKGLIDTSKGISKTFANGHGEVNIRKNATDYSAWGVNIVGAIVIQFPNQTSYQEFLEISVVNVQYANLFQKLNVQIYGNSIGLCKASYINDTDSADYVNLLRVGINPAGNRCLIINDINTVWDYPQVIVDRFNGGGRDTAVGNWATELVTDLSAYTIQTNVPIIKAINTSNLNDYVKKSGDTMTGVLNLKNLNSQVLNGGQIIHAGNADELYFGNPSVASVYFESGNSNLLHNRAGYGVGVIWDSHNLDPVTRNSEQTILSKKTFSGATDNSYTGAPIMINGNGATNTVYPTLSFHQPTLYAGTISYRNDIEFSFMDINGNSYKFVKSAGFRKDGSDDNYLLLGGGSHKAVSDFATSASLNDYVHRTIDQDVNGLKTFTGSYTAWLLNNDSSNGRGFLQSLGGRFAVGTTNDKDLVFYRNVQEKLFIGDTYAQFVNPVFSQGFNKVGFDNSSVLLAGGGAKAVSDFQAAGSYVTTNTEQIISARKIINKDLGTNEYVNVAQHNAQFQIGRVSDAKSLEFAVTDDGFSYIQSKEAGVGYNPLILNRANNGGVAIGGLPIAGHGLTVNSTVYSDGYHKAGSTDDWFLTGGGGHINKYTKDDSFTNSGRDFANGTLISTTIDYSQNEGESFLLEIKGNMYAGGLVMDCKIQGYIYGGTIINQNGYSTNPLLNNVVAMNIGGNLCFWFPRLAYWQGFSVKAVTTGGGGTTTINRVTTITDSTEPTGTKKVNITVYPMATQSWVNNQDFATNGNLNNKVNKSGDTMTGMLNFANNTGGISGMIADNDYWRVYGSNTGSNQGYLEIATGDDGDEPIHVRQYSGPFTSVVRTATLLDASGNTEFPNTTRTKKLIANYPTSTSGQNLGSGGVGNTLELRNYDAYGTNFWTKDSGAGYIQQQRFDGNPVAYALYLQPLGGQLFYGNNEVATVNQIPSTSNFITTDSTPQSKTGNLSFNDGANIRINGTDSNWVRSYRDTTGNVGIVSAFEYAHYANRWKAGMKRGAGVDSLGFAFELTTDDGATYIEKVRIQNDSNIVTQSFGSANEWKTAYSWGNHANAGYVTQSQLNANDRSFLSDTRGAVRPPSFYDDRYAQWDFQYVGDTQAGGDAWHGVLTVAKWDSFDPSHRQEQLLFTGDNLKRRTAIDDNTWGDVKTIWDSGNFDPNSYYRINGGGVNNQADLLPNGNQWFSIGDTGSTFDGALSNKTIEGTVANFNAYDSNSKNLGFSMLARTSTEQGIYYKTWYGGGSQTWRRLLEAGDNTVRSIGFEQGNINLSPYIYTLDGQFRYLVSQDSFPNNSNWASSFVNSGRKVVRELGWANYGNGHTIFDISSGTAPWGVAKSNVDAEVPWSPTYPTLVGGNGSNTYGVRVDTARTADNLSNVPLNRFVFGENSTGTNSISLNQLNSNGYALKSGFYTTTEGSSITGTDVGFILHTAYLGEGNVAGFDLMSGDYINGNLYHRNATGAGKGNWYKLWSEVNFTQSNIDNWNASYGWGNHANAGYATQTWVQEYVQSNFPNQTLSISGEINGGQTLSLSNGNSVQITNNLVNVRDNGTRNPDNFVPNANPHRVRFDFVQSNYIPNATGNYAGLMTFSPYDGTSGSTGDSSYQMVFANQNGVNGQGVPMIKIRTGIDGGWSNSWWKLWSSYDFSQSHINAWNNATSGIMLNQQFTWNTGNGIAIVDDYAGGESGLYDMSYDKMIAGRDGGEYYKYGSAYGNFDGINFHFGLSLIGIGREIGNDEDKVQLAGNLSVDARDISDHDLQLILNPLYNDDGNVANSRNAHIYIVTGSPVMLPNKPIRGQRIEIFNRSDSTIPVSHNNIGVLFYLPAWRKITGISGARGFIFDEEPVPAKMYDI